MDACQSLLWNTQPVLTFHKGELIVSATIRSFTIVKLLESANQFMRGKEVSHAHT